MRHPAEQKNKASTQFNDDLYDFALVGEYQNLEHIRIFFFLIKTAALYKLKLNLNRLSLKYSKRLCRLIFWLA